MMVLVWWHWMLVGLLLLGLELLFPSFPMIWFGFGGMLTGMVLLLVPGCPVWIQVFFWIVISVCFTTLWRNYLRPKKEQRLKHRNIVSR